MGKSDIQQEGQHRAFGPPQGHAEHLDRKSPGCIPAAGVSGMSNQEDTQGQIQDTLESLHVLSGLEMPWCVTGGAGGSGQGRGWSGPLC